MWQQLGGGRGDWEEINIITTVICNSRIYCEGHILGNIFVGLLAKIHFLPSSLIAQNQKIYFYLIQTETAITEFFNASQYAGTVQFFV